MRIAISGSHCSGKSTLIESFLEKRPDYQHELEAYEVLEELHGESFSAEPTADDFLRQLECHVEQLNKYSAGDLVIFERCAADYVAYIKALAFLNREDFGDRVLRRAITIATESLASLDLIVFLSTDECDKFVSDEEDLELRAATNRILASILVNDELGTASGPPIVIEVSGSTEDRLLILQNTLV
jgi:predicted ATPase